MGDIKTEKLYRATLTCHQFIGALKHRRVIYGHTYKCSVVHIRLDSASTTLPKSRLLTGCPFMSATLKTELPLSSEHSKLSHPGKACSQVTHFQALYKKPGTRTKILVNIINFVTRIILLD